MARILKFQFPALLWAVVIFISSAMPTDFYLKFGVDGLWAPKVVHVLFFFFLCLFLNRAFKNQRGSLFLARWSLPMSIVLCLMFGTLDEVHQIFVAGRHPRVTDVLLDLTGATLMAVTLWVWDRRQGVRRERITP